MEPEKNAATLEQALAILREQYGAQIAGPERETQVSMRKLLEQKMGLDESNADRVVKKLCETGKLTYVGTDTGGGAGVMAAVPGATTTPDQGTADVPAGIITTGALNSPIGTFGSTATGAGAAALASISDSARLDSRREPVLGGTASREQSENREGATMGELADTNVEGDTPRGPETIGQQQNAGKDNTQGYWQIG